jgi:glycine oxidase
VRVLVVGAGIIGAGIAEALARRGVEVTVLDPRSAGRGASRASAGILAPYVEAAEDGPLLPLAVRSLAMYDEFVAGISARSGRSIEYARSGTLQIALSEADVAHLQSAGRWLDQRGVRHERLNASDLRSQARAVTPTAMGGLLIHEHALVGVAALVAALVQSARLAGAVFESAVEVSRIVPGADGVRAVVDGRRIDADIVVLAAGSWSGRVRIDGVRALPVRPVRGQLMQLSWLSSGVDAPRHVIWGPDCYTVPWSDGSLLVGATTEEVGFDERATLAGVRALSTAATALLPPAANATVLEIRAGLRPATPDGLPIIGSFAAAPRVWTATGHFRNGILLAPITAALVSRALVDGVVDDALSATSPDRFG